MLPDRRRLFLAAVVLLAPFAAPAAFAQAPAKAELNADLAIAAQNDRGADIKSLIARGADPNALDVNGEPPLYIAARAGNAAAADALLEMKAAVDTPNRFGDTPIMVAALNGHMVLVGKLRKRGAAVNRTGWTPLIYAATGGHDAIVAFVLDEGAEVNARSPNGTTALMMAVREGKASTVELLLKRGADANLRNQNNVSALDWAKRGNEKAIEERLRRAGAKD